jgi:hypothetical protein
VKAFVVLIFLIVLIGVVILVIRKRKFSELPPEIQTGIERAQDTRAKYHRVLRDHNHSMSAAQHDLEALEDAKGRRLESDGGVMVYERWIDTPQGGGSLIGVKATAEDDSSVAQRITVTRMVAFGIFSLAAPKKRTTGNAYVVIEGPHVSGVAVIPAAGGISPGQRAFTFAAEINNAARAAEDAAPLLPGRIEAARLQLATSSDETMVNRAQQAYDEAVASLPAEYREHVPRRLKLDDWV